MLLIQGLNATDIYRGNRSFAFIGFSIGCSDSLIPEYGIEKSFCCAIFSIFNFNVINNGE